MNVAEIMSADPCAVDSETTLAAASTLMAERHIGSVLIVDGDSLAGILTERDIVRAMSNTHDAPTRPVAEWMTRKPATTSPDTPVRRALQIMVEGQFRHLPVCDAAGKPVGVLSMRDVARALAD